MSVRALLRASHTFLLPLPRLRRPPTLSLPPPHAHLQTSLSDFFSQGKKASTKRGVLSESQARRDDELIRELEDAGTGDGEVVMGSAGAGAGAGRPSRRAEADSDDEEEEEFVPPALAGQSEDDDEDEEEPSRPAPSPSRAPRKTGVSTCVRACVCVRACACVHSCPSPPPPQRPASKGFKSALSKLGKIVDEKTKLEEKMEELKASKKSALAVCRRWASDFDGDTHGSLKLVPLGVAGLSDAERLARMDAHIEWLFAKRRLIANRLAITDKEEEIAVAEREVARMRERSVKAKVPAGASQGADDF